MGHICNKAGTHSVSGMCCLNSEKLLSRLVNTGCCLYTTSLFSFAVLVPPKDYHLFFKYRLSLLPYMVVAIRVLFLASIQVVFACPVKI